MAARVALAILPVAACGLLLGPGAVDAASTQPDISIEAWYARAKPTPPQVQVPGQSPVSPGDVVPAPQADDGDFVVSTAGGKSGGDQGDIGWSADQWDVLDALGGAVQEFVVTYTESPNNKNDFGDAAHQVEACNASAPFGGSPGANPWDDRPKVDCTSAVAPKVKKDGKYTRYTFDLTEMAQTWADGTGYGAVLVPGDAKNPDASLTPFQITFAGYTTKSKPLSEVTPKVTFRFTAAALPAGGGTTSATVAPAPVDTGGSAAAPEQQFEANPSIDVNPNDVGSPPVDETPTTAAPAPSGNDQNAAAEPQPAAKTVSATSGKFPWAAWFLVPLALVAFFFTGTALGPGGDPVPVREGGVSRVLAERRAARAAGELPPLTPSQEP